MFPGSNAIIERNDVGEVVGWDYPADSDTYYCDVCGFSHVGPCPDDLYDDEDETEDHDG